MPYFPVMARLIVVSLVLGLTGCAEGYFDLSAESRLPKWLDLPPGMTRQDVTVTMDTYLFPVEKDVFTLRDKSGRTINVIKASRLGGYDSPKQLKNPPLGFPADYPSYEVLVSHGVVDIIEHRRMEPIFYTTDNPAVWAEIGPKASGG